MNVVTSKFWVLAALAGSMTAFAADTAPTGTVPPPPSVTKDCKNLAADARRECEKVAVQMDESAQGKPTPSGEVRANGKADPVNPSEPMHSSPIMMTPDQKIAADAVKKGKDPKQALDKAHVKEQQAASQAH